jgi:hypothetical protein
MPIQVMRVSWSPEADRDLETAVTDPAMRDVLKRNAEETLHEPEECGDEDRSWIDRIADEGRVGEIMWHRGWTHEQERQTRWQPEDMADDGPWNYVLFYRKAVGPTVFEVVAVRSRVQIADRWEQMNGR